MIDTHCHLTDPAFDADREQVIDEAIGAGVGGFVVPSVNRAGFEPVLSLCRENALCIPALGIHPLALDHALDSDLDVLAQTIARHRPAALGEIGLDRFVRPYDESRQAFFFVRQLQLARAFDLPVLLHVRRAIDPVLALLRRYPVRGGIAHAFNGSIQQAQALIQMGFKLGFGGAATFPRATRLRHLVASLPLESMVLETDAPDLSPAWCARGRNSPTQLPRIARELAALRGMALSSFAQATTRNACALLAAPAQGIV
jgi:TatD DNase family protein